MAADGAEWATIAGTTIARGGRGILLRGPPGSGKSDLALRALTIPLRLPGDDAAITFELVSDDQTEVTRAGAHVIARAPAAIRDLIEVRGLGIVAWPAVVEVEIVLVADLVTTEPERMPEENNQSCRLLDVSVGRIDILAHDASAVQKLALAVRDRSANSG